MWSVDSALLQHNRVSLKTQNQRSSHQSQYWMYFVPFLVFSLAWRLCRPYKWLFWYDFCICLNWNVLVIDLPQTEFDIICIYSFCNARTAHQRTRSPPPPALQYGWKIATWHLLLPSLFVAFFFLCSMIFRSNNSAPTANSPSNTTKMIK